MSSASSMLRALRAHQRNLAYLFRPPLQESTRNPISPEGQSILQDSTLSQLQHRGFSSSAAHASSQHARVLDGRKASAAWIDELSIEVQDATKVLQRPPGLAVVLVGRRADSLLYVTRKQEAAHRAGIAVHIYPLPEQVSQEGVEAAVRAACHHPEVDGVLIQLPLPRHLSEEAVMEHLDPHKDVDGFHPLNMGRILMRGRTPYLVPCTPLGCMQLLRRSNISVKGKSAVVVGDSNIVGTPLAAMLRDEGAAAVTICHRISYSDWFASYEATLLQQQDRARAAAAACLPQLPGPRPVEARPAAAPADATHAPPDALHPSPLQATTTSPPPPPPRPQQQPRHEHSVGASPAAAPPGAPHPMQSSPPHPMQSHVLTPPPSPTIYHPPGGDPRQQQRNDSSSSATHSEPRSHAHTNQPHSTLNSTSSVSTSSSDSSNNGGGLHGYSAPTNRPSSFQDGDPPEWQALHAVADQQRQEQQQQQHQQTQQHCQQHQQQPAHPHAHTQPDSAQHAAPHPPQQSHPFSSLSASPYTPASPSPKSMEASASSQQQTPQSAQRMDATSLSQHQQGAPPRQPQVPPPRPPASRRPPSPETSLSGQLPGICRAADLLVVACGCPELVRADWVKRGAVVLDVGINVMPVSSTSMSNLSPNTPAASSSSISISSSSSSSSSSGGNNSNSSQVHRGSASNNTSNNAHGSSVLASGTFQVVGDVHFSEVSKVASAVSPVPGGLGPMTIAALLHNTVRAARLTASAAKSSEARAAEQHAARLNSEAKGLPF